MSPDESGTGETLHSKMPSLRAKLGDLGSHSTNGLWACMSHISLDRSFLSDWHTGQGTERRSQWFTQELAATWVALAGLVPTNAHPDIGLARVVLSECGHRISLVNIKADLQALRLLQKPEDRVRNLRKQGLPSFLSMPPFPSPSSCLHEN